MFSHVSVHPSIHPSICLSTGGYPVRSSWGGNTPARSSQGGTPARVPGGTPAGGLPLPGYPCQGSTPAGDTLPWVPPSDLTGGTPPGGGGTPLRETDGVLDTPRSVCVHAGGLSWIKTCLELPCLLCSPSSHCM